MSNHCSLLPSATRAPHYGVLLFVLCLLIIFAPVATKARSAYGVEAMFNLVLIAGAYSAAARGRQRSPFLALTALTLVMRWGAMLSAGFGLELASATATVAWIAFAIVIVVRELFLQHEVTTNTILGAIVSYFLAAVAGLHIASGIKGGGGAR